MRRLAEYVDAKSQIDLHISDFDDKRKEAPGGILIKGVETLSGIQAFTRESLRVSLSVTRPNEREYATWMVLVGGTPTLRFEARDGKVTLYIEPTSRTLSPDHKAQLCSSGFRLRGNKGDLVDLSFHRPWDCDSHSVWRPGVPAKSQQLLQKKSWSRRVVAADKDREILPRGSRLLTQLSGAWQCEAAMLSSAANGGSQSQRSETILWRLPEGFPQAVKLETLVTPTGKSSATREVNVETAMYVNFLPTLIAQDSLRVEQISALTSCEFQRVEADKFTKVMSARRRLTELWTFGGGKIFQGALSSKPADWTSEQGEQVVAAYQHATEVQNVLDSIGESGIAVEFQIVAPLHPVETADGNAFIANGTDLPPPFEIEFAKSDRFESNESAKRAAGISCDLLWSEPATK